MKKISVRLIPSLFIMLLFLTACNAQKYGRIKGNGNVVNKTRSVGDFDRIGVSGSFDVTLVKGNEGEIKIRIEDNLLSYLETDVEAGKLKIKWRKGTNINTTKGVHLTVYFNDIEAVGLSGSGEIVSDDMIKSDNFDIAVAGSGDIDLNVETNQLKAAISGSGDIQLKGSTDEFTAAISGSGDIEAFGFRSKKATIKISGSGDMEISVSEELTARVSGSGDIKYKGNPRKEDIKVSGSGEISSY